MPLNGKELKKATVSCIKHDWVDINPIQESSWFFFDKIGSVDFRNHVCLNCKVKRIDLNASSREG